MLGTCKVITEYKITGGHCTGHLPCISLRWPNKISSRTHSNGQSRHEKMADQFRHPILYSV